MTPVLKHRLDLAFNNFFIKRGVQRSLDQICYCLMLLSLKSLDKSAGCFDSTLFLYFHVYRKNESWIDSKSYFLASNETQELALF